MTAYERILNSWGERPPQFIVALADAVDRTSQSEAARIIGISDTAVNLLLGNKYPAKTDGPERKIRNQLMHEVIFCPYMRKDIPRRECDDYQKSPMTTANPKIFQHKRACMTCSAREK